MGEPCRSLGPTALGGRNGYGRGWGKKNWVNDLKLVPTVEPLDVSTERRPIDCVHTHRHTHTHRRTHRLLPGFAIGFPHPPAGRHRTFTGFFLFFDRLTPEFFGSLGSGSF